MKFGKIKTSLLNGAADVFYALSRCDFSLMNKSLYKVLRILFEKITKSYVLRAVSAKDYCSTHQLERLPLVTDRKGYYANVVWAGSDNKQELYETDLPDICLCHFNNVIVHRNSDLIIDLPERLAINDYCATASDDSNKTYDDAITKAFSGNILIVRFADKQEEIEEAISLNGKYSFNYYHAVYETLIKLVVVAEQRDNIPQAIPFLIDQDTVQIPSLFRIFEILSSGLNHDYISIPFDHSYKVKSLYWISPVNYLTPNHKDYLLAKNSEYVFDREFTLKLKERILEHKSNRVFPKRIFVSRKGMNHRQFNEDELFAILEPYGFEKVYPQELTIEEQAALFNGAEWIISGSGAALTNLLFCSKGCGIICLIRNVNNVSPVFVPPVCFNDSSMVYFKSSKGEGGTVAHTDFTIDVNQFSDYIIKIESLFDGKQ